MAKQDINIGAANAKEGDDLLTAFTKINDNFTENYASIEAIDTDNAAFDDRLKVVEGVTPVAVPGGMFVSDGAGGGEFIRIQGWSQSADTDTTVGTPSQNIATGVRTQWSNDAGTTNIQKAPSDLTLPLWDNVGNKIQPISAFDTYNIRIDFKAQNYAGSTPYLTVELDIGGSIGVIVSRTIRLIKGGAEQRILNSFPVFAGSTFLANGGKIYLTYTGTGTCDIYGSTILIIRESKNYV
jgi:hypothetical protein